MLLGQKLFGNYLPGQSLVHLTPLWVKVVALILVSGILVITNHWYVSVTVWLLILSIGKLASISLRSWLESYRPMLPLLIILALYYLWMQQFQLGTHVVLCMLALVSFSRVFLSTTRMPEIIDGFVKLCKPLSIFGISSDRIGLAIALMMRSIPVIMNEYSLIKQAHQARGISPLPHRLITPLVIATISYAHETGDALWARGIDQ